VLREVSLLGESVSTAVGVQVRH